jgi:hypothetical protein
MSGASKEYALWTFSTTAAADFDYMEKKLNEFWEIGYQLDRMLPLSPAKVLVVFRRNMTTVVSLN